MTAGVTVCTHEALREDPALQESAELVLDVPRDLDPAGDEVYGVSLRASALAGIEHERRLQEEREKKSPK
jgi:hypothetical protein